MLYPRGELMKFPLKETVPAVSLFHSCLRREKKEGAT